MKQEIYESGEDYLETILMISKEKDSVRAIDIAHHLNFSKPSVSRALVKLKEQGHIEIEKNLITLTPSGLDIATKIYERHLVFTDFLKHIGVSEEAAKNDACKLEHAISSETFEKLKVYIDSVLKKEV